ncbi:MAG: hypothetical protein ACYTGX_06705 [Planctomycetota bacterium]|jgi:hypothetical protein
MPDDPREELQPLDPKEASRWITSQIRAKKETARRPARPADPMPLDPAEASKLIAERIRAKGKTAQRPAEMKSDEVVLARPIPRERLISLIRADAQTLTNDRGDGEALQGQQISLAEFEFLVKGGKRTKRAAPADDEDPTKKPTKRL